MKKVHRGKIRSAPFFLRTEILGLNAKIGIVPPYRTGSGRKPFSFGACVPRGERLPMRQLGSFRLSPKGGDQSAP